MEIDVITEPAWRSLSHHDRTVYLDGNWINDVPSFYLSLGKAVNGPNGHFGHSLDALEDCLCGCFGVLPPLTIQLSNFNEVRNALNRRAWCRFQAEHFHNLRGADIEELVGWGFLGDGSPADVALWTIKYEAAFIGEPFEYHEFGSYFDSIVKVLETKGAKIVPANEAAR